MSSGWDLKSLSTVCEIKPPKSEARRKLSESDLVSFIPMEDLGVDQKFIVGRQVRRLSQVLGSYTYFADGDVLLAKITPCFENGKLGIAANLENGTGFGSSEYIVLRARANLDPQWLYYYLARSSFRAEGEARMGGAVGHKRLAKEFVESYLIPIPQLSEQRRIVAILDETFAGIATCMANAEKSARSARDLFDGRLRELFLRESLAWNRKTLREIALDFGRGKSKHRPRNDPSLYDGPYPFIQTGDVRSSDHLITEYSQTYSEAGLAQSKLWPKGTLCITIAANIAETGILDFDACFPDSVIGVVVDPAQTGNKFLEYLLQSLKAYLKAKGKGSAQDNINLATFENEMLPFPDLAVQSKVTKELDELADAVRAIESIYTRKIAALDELKQSLLQQAFSGKL